MGSGLSLEGWEEAIYEKSAGWGEVGLWVELQAKGLESPKILTPEGAVYLEKRKESVTNSC